MGMTKNELARSNVVLRLKISDVCVGRLYKPTVSEKSRQYKEKTGVKREGAAPV